ncbi:hypothetical protein [Streptosporangium brasiliense]|uniref:hypothetical protein n=1 Tax=Streptosporangium brasiliense TaxID=47480 RepID=UPI0027D8693D|nr:hypothetical protein [Streptosporangium brasiliense]
MGRSPVGFTVHTAEEPGTSAENRLDRMRHHPGLITVTGRISLHGRDLRSSPAAVGVSRRDTSPATRP